MENMGRMSLGLLSLYGFSLSSCIILVVIWSMIKDVFLMHFDLLVFSVDDAKRTDFISDYGESSSAYKFDGISLKGGGLLVRDSHRYAGQLRKREWDIDSDHPYDNGKSKLSVGGGCRGNGLRFYDVDAVVDVDGNWFDSTYNGAWDDFMGSMIEELPDDALISAYDCHK